MWETILQFLAPLFSGFAQTIVTAMQHVAEKHPSDALLQAVKDLVQSAEDIATDKKGYVLKSIQADFAEEAEALGLASLNFLIEAAVQELQHLAGK